MIVLPPLSDGHSALGRTLLDLADARLGPWVLIGGQMVLLHTLSRGRMSPRVSTDLDLVADVRATPGAARRIATRLLELGFEVRAGNMNGIGHRFRPTFWAPWS
ncbi:MAG: hypothetical protein RIB67_03155 [Miltoncostaeaceae bacterium]